MRLLNGDTSPPTDEGLLELLLTYGIPRRDVQPLAKTLLSRFGNLDQVLAASPDALCAVEGVKTTTAALLKIVDHLRKKSMDIRTADKLQERNLQQPTGAPFLPGRMKEITSIAAKPTAYKPPRPRYGTELFGKAALREAIQLLPSLPDSESLDEIREHLRKNLH